MLRYGVRGNGLGLCSGDGSSPDPLPSACSDPSFSASILKSIGTTERIVRRNILVHCFSLTVSP